MEARSGLTMMLVLAAAVACSDDSVSPTGGSGGASSQGGSGGAGGAPRVPCDAMYEFSNGSVEIGAVVADVGVVKDQSGAQQLYFRTDGPGPRFGSATLQRSGGATSGLVSETAAHDLVIGSGTFGPEAIGNTSPGAGLTLFAPDLYGAGPQLLLTGESAPRFVSSRSEDVLVGTVVDGALRLLRYSVGFGESQLGAPIDWGGSCASTPMRASVLSHPNGYLIAQTSGSPWLTCDGPPGPATRLQIAQGGYGADNVPALVDEVELTSPALALHLLPRDLGYWLVVEGTEALTVYRTADGGDLVEQPFEIALRPDGGRPAIAGSGGRLAVGQIRTDGQGERSLSIRMFHPEGVSGIEYTTVVDATSDALVLGDDVDVDGSGGVVVLWRRESPMSVNLAVSHLACAAGDF